MSHSVSPHDFLAQIVGVRRRRPFGQGNPTYAGIFVAAKFQAKRNVAETSPICQVHREPDLHAVEYGDSTAQQPDLQATS